MMTDTHTYTHPCLLLILRVHRYTHVSGRFFYSTSRSASITHTHTRTHTRLVEICLMTNTHNHAHAWLRCTTHVYRSVSLSRMRRYTQLAYLFHQCATSLLSRDGRIADCTVRHPSVKRSFSSLNNSYTSNFQVCVEKCPTENWFYDPTLSEAELRAKLICQYDFDKSDTSKPLLEHIQDGQCAYYYVNSESGEPIYTCRWKIPAYVLTDIQFVVNHS